MPFASYARSILFGLLLTLTAHHVAAAKSPWQWVSFRRAPVDGDLVLTESAGPWLVYAASFAGHGAEHEARQLATELRQRFRLRSFVHSQQFDFTEPVEGIGINKDRTPKIMRYDKSGVFDEFAVLIGDFESIDDPDLQKTLRQIKYAKPECLTKSGDKTTRRFAGLRALHRRVNGDQTKKSKGPMGNAFATPNPKLPREAYAPRGADTFVIKMNEGVKHSLLDCPGNFSVRVATFRGNVIIDQQKVVEIENGVKGMKSRLEEAAQKANRLTTALREKGVEAYEFHDRHESYVTVGSFGWVGQDNGNGLQEMNPKILATIQQFVPDKQLQPGPNGQTVRARVLNGLPFDVQPWPVEVPRRSIAKDYARS